MKDAQKAALNELGYTGSNQDMENKFFFDALGKKLPNSQGLYEWLSSLGYSSYSLQDRLNMYLRGLGYSGSINDMLKKAFKEKTFYNAMKSILNKYFPNAHAYLPGAQTPVLGSELVLSGNTLTGWASSGALTSTAEVVSGEIRVTPTAGYGSQLYTLSGLKIGSTYNASAFTRRVSGSASAFFGVTANAGGYSAAIIGSTNTSESFVQQSGSFVASATIMYLCLRDNTSSTTVVNAFKDISIREILSYNDVISGFHTGNYVESTGVTPATVDQPVGLVLDAAGSVGAELAPALEAANWGVVNADATHIVTFSGGTVRYQSDTTTPSLTLQKTGLLTIGKTYKVEITVSSYTSGSLKSDVSTGIIVGAVGKFTFNVQSASTAFNLYRNSANVDLTISSISIREITGIHASQSTSGFRPVERRGIVNLLLNNKWDGGGTAPTGWTAFGAGGAQGSVLPNGCYTRTFAPVASRDFINSNFTTAANTTYTIVLYVESNSGLLANELIGSGTIPAGATFAISGTTAPTGSYLFATLTVGATGGTFTLRCGAGCSGPVTGSATLSQPAIFQGTLTASQILAMGGIPLTTTAAASSAMGPYYLEHNAANTQRLSLSSVPFNYSDDWCVVAAFSSSSTVNQNIFSITGAVAQIALKKTTVLSVYVADDSGANAIIISPATFNVGSVYVVTARKVGSVVTIRVNGGNVASGSPSLGATTFTASTIGGHTTAQFLDGNIYACLPIKGTLSLAEITLLEKQAAQAAGIQL